MVADVIVSLLSFKSSFPCLGHPVPPFVRKPCPSVSFHSYFVHMQIGDLSVQLGDYFSFLENTLIHGSFLSSQRLRGFYFMNRLQLIEEHLVGFCCFFPPIMNSAMTTSYKSVSLHVCPCLWHKLLA